MEKSFEAEVRVEGSEEQESLKKGNEIMATEEIQIEEMAIDGICGVY